MQDKFISKIALIYIISGVLSPIVESHPHSSNQCNNFVPTKPLPYPTYGPIAIDSRKTSFVNTSKPLVIQNGVFGPLFAENTGYALEVHGNPNVISGGAMYGGELCGDYFIFNFLRFYINQDVNGRSYGTIDGEGTPLTLQFVYHNSKYASLDEAKNHRDGVFILSYMIGFSPLPNVYFIPLQILLPLFRFPGTKVYVAPEILLYLWTNVLSANYWGYPSSYTDIKTGKQYQCAFEITPPIFRILGKSQFEAFSFLLNKNYTKLHTTSDIYPQGERPVYEGVGYKEVFTLF